MAAERTQLNCSFLIKIYIFNQGAVILLSPHCKHFNIVGNVISLKHQ
jgi:hypothetical protein